jgi:hypothetical protein
MDYQHKIEKYTQKIGGAADKNKKKIYADKLEHYKLSQAMAEMDKINKIIKKHNFS